MLVKKYGLPEPDEVHLHTYAEAGRLDGFAIHAGDSEGVLKGTRLDQVLEIEAGALYFKPKTLSRANQQDVLTLVSEDPAASALLQPEQSLPLRVTLKDGRVLDLNLTVAARRPSVSLISKSVQYDRVRAPVAGCGSAMPDELPQEAHLNFFLKTQAPEAFPLDRKIEVATDDESFRVLLSFKDGNLTLQDSRTVLPCWTP